MTRILPLTTFILVLFTLHAHAQLQFGINAGLNYPDLSHESPMHDRWKGGWGLRVGGFSELSFGKTGLRLGLSYSQNHIKDNFDYDLQLHYLSMPFSFYYKPIDKLKILAGPEVNWLIHQQGPDYYIPLGEEDFEAFDYGIHLEVEYRLLESWGISLRNYFGLQYNGTYSDLSGKTIAKLDRLNVVSLSANYYFGKTD